MKTYTLPVILLVFAAVVTLSCGSSSSTPRLLQSVTVSPASADADNFPNGTVQFTATGFFTTRPSTVTPLPTQWGACFQGGTTTDVAIETTGAVHCLSTAHGTYTIFTENYSTMDDAAGGGCTATSACGGGCFITGTAQLTCP